jgi:glycosyltransferase involved in cell wall biosynthesis
METLTYYLCQDLLPWEKECLAPLLRGLREKGAKGVSVTDADKGRLKKSKGVSWVLTRDWKSAYNFLGGGDYFSLFDFVIPKPALSTILWKALFQVPGKVRFIAHSPLQYRFLTEIEKMPVGKALYLPLPFPEIPESKETLGKTGRRVGVFGEFTVHSNLNYVLNIAHYVFSQNENVKFFIMGKGVLYPHLSQMVRELGLEKQVEIVETDAINLIRQMDLLLYMPLRNHHFLPLLAAASCRVPVLATEIEGISSYLKDGHNGFIFPQHETRPLGELILRLASDEDLANCLGNKLHADLSNTWNAQKLVPEYLKTLGLSGRSFAESAA